MATAREDQNFWKPPPPRLAPCWNDRQAAGLPPAGCGDERVIGLSAYNHHIEAADV